MLVDETGETTITNDGATILKLLDVKHPAAKLGFSLLEVYAKFESNVKSELYFKISSLISVRTWNDFANFWSSKPLSKAPLSNCRSTGLRGRWWYHFGRYFRCRTSQGNDFTDNVFSVLKSYKIYTLIEALVVNFFICKKTKIPIFKCPAGL